MTYSLQLTLMTLVFAPTGPVPEGPELLARTVAFHTIDASNEDFSDLEPLVKLIGSSRVVQLSENNHGEGSSFRARSRMIKFLHQRMQFDVIVFESPFGALRDVNDALSSRAPMDAVLAKGVESK